MQTPWVDRFAQRTQRMQSSAIREILKFTQLPGVISFAGLVLILMLKIS
jgi:2-aminoadipate transaminase